MWSIRRTAGWCTAGLLTAVLLGLGASASLQAAGGYSNLDTYLNSLAGDTAPLALLPPQLLLHWRFDETSGTTAVDATGHGWDGTLQAGATRTTGRIGPFCLQTNGINQYVSNGALVWPAAQPITVLLWVNVPGGTPNGTFDLGGSTERIGAHIPYSDNVLYWDYGPALTSGRLTTDFTPYLGRWTHVALVGDANFQAIYLNGQLVTSSSLTNPQPAQVTGVEVGRYVVGAVGTAYHTGLIDDFKLWTYRLSPAEIRGEAGLGAGAGTGFFPLFFQ